MNASETENKTRLMSTPKHTPGPWVTGSGNCHTVYSQKRNGRQRIIAKCPTQEGLTDYDSVESFQNARLIASAPLLLLELEKAVEHMSAQLNFCREGIEDPTTSQSTRSSLFKLGNEIEKDLTSALASIAKATGEAK